MKVTVELPDTADEIARIVADPDAYIAEVRAGVAERRRCRSPRKNLR